MKHIILFIACFLSSFLVMADCANRNVDILETKPNSLYEDHGDGTVTDKETGLMWQKCGLGLSGNDCSMGTATTFTWQAALAVANENTQSNYSDWRLPNVKELFSIVEVACYFPAINSVAFPNTVTAINGYRSSTLSKKSDNTVKIVRFLRGDVKFSLKNVNLNVRLVRNVK